MVIATMHFLTALIAPRCVRVARVLIASVVLLIRKLCPPLPFDISQKPSTMAFAGVEAVRYIRMTHSYRSRQMTSPAVAAISGLKQSALP
eukprot:8847041-Alexandrium_andersonii.AAC.1